jgi:hypothetical protein
MVDSSSRTSSWQGVDAIHAVFFGGRGCVCCVVCVEHAACLVVDGAVQALVLNLVVLCFFGDGGGGSVPAVQVLGTRDLTSYLAARKIEDSEAIRGVPSLVFSRDVVKFATGSIATQAGLVVRWVELQR